MAGEKILIVEDDKHIAKLIRCNLEKSGYACAAAESGHEAFEVLRKQSVDLMILDIMLPDMDGFEICRTAKRDEVLKNIPIIMLTAKGEEVDRIVGLELGADDYMVKPFSPRELILRVKAVLRRRKTHESKPETLTIGPITVDNSRHKVIAYQKEISLTLMEFKLLVILMERAGRVQSRDQLLSDVWDIHSEVSTRTVDTHVKRLREKLGKTGKLIDTVIGVGYRFKQEDDEA